MAIFKFALAIIVLCAVTEAQRPFYAGLRSIGYPKVKSNVLTNRLGKDLVMPIEARGDGNLIKGLNRIPLEKRPFWYLNWRQYEALRKNPQTYQVRPNGFVDRNFIRK